jgi:hypothetical protein
MNPAQPRLPVPKWWRLREQLKYRKYYVNLASTPEKLRMLLRRFRFGPVRDVLKEISDWPIAACVETS